MQSSLTNWGPEMWFDLSKWQFDPITFVITSLLAPLFIYFLATTRKTFTTLSRYVVDGLLQAFSRVATQKIAGLLSLRSYCKMQLLGENRYLNVPGAVDINLEIDKIFVPIALDQPGLSHTYNHTDLMTVGNRIRIIGDPGSGKSSIAKRLFRDECNKAVSGLGEARLPVFIELRRLEIPKTVAHKNLADWLFNYIRQFTKEFKVYEMERCFGRAPTTSVAHS